MSKADKVLITGAAGFIGSHLACRLASEGRSVLGVDNFDGYYSRLEKQINVQRTGVAGAEFAELDIRNVELVASQVRDFRPDVVVHLAAKAGVRNSVAFPRDYFDVNVVGTQNILDACRQAPGARLVFASTSSVYGHTERIPFEEADPCVSPLHPYAASKRASELMIMTYARLYGLQSTVFRFFTVYGPHGRPDMMPRLLVENIRNGAPVSLFEGGMARDWTYVDDIVEGLVRGVDHPVGFEIVNLGGGRPVSLADFISALEVRSGARTSLSPAPRPASEMLSTHADVTKLKSLFGFVPAIPVEDGVAALWDWRLRFAAVLD